MDLLFADRCIAWKILPRSYDTFELLQRKRQAETQKAGFPPPPLFALADRIRRRRQRPASPISCGVKHYTSLPSSDLLLAIPGDELETTQKRLPMESAGGMGTENTPLFSKGCSP
jgi:hypothetical protein